MNMQHRDSFRRMGSALMGALRVRHEERVGCIIRGDIFMTLRDAKTKRVQRHQEFHNLIVRDASILVARLMKDNQEPPKAAYVLAVGTGDSGWNPMSPPAPTNTQRALYSELTRKTFSSTEFIDSTGVPVARPTNVVDFTTTFVESEAVGPLVEMGLIGGNISTNLSIRNAVTPANGPYDSPIVDLTTKETLINYLTFPVWNKPATSELEIVWRLTF
jgi:hypothetical protein